MASDVDISTLTPPEEYVVQELDGGGVAVSLIYEGWVRQILYGVIVGVFAFLGVGQSIGGMLELWHAVAAGLFAGLITIAILIKSTSVVIIYPDRLLTMKSMLNDKIVYGRKEIALSPASELELVASDYTERDKKNGLEPFLDTIIIKTGDEKMEIDEWGDKDAVWGLELIKHIISTGR